MGKYARITPGQPRKPIRISQPFSNFDFIDDEFKGSPIPLRRIMSQVRMHGGQTMVVEDLNPNQADDLREENEDIAKRYSRFSSSIVCRLSFFTKGFSTLRGLSSVTDDEFIGYVIIKSDRIPLKGWLHRIYESVIRPSQRPNNFIRGSQTWDCLVAGCLLKVKGCLYAQQNMITNVCAHVALRTAAAFFREGGDMTYRKMNDMLGIKHLKRKFGKGKGLKKGLRTDEMVKVLEAAGAACFTCDYRIHDVEKPPFQKYVYGSIESGFPAIVCFGTTAGECHAIPVFGHTFNEDTWVPNAIHSYFEVGPGTKYIPSESWVSTYVAHDDNFGSNYCVPRRFLYTRRYCDEWPKEPKPWCKMQSESVIYVISTFPKEIKVGAIKAEAMGAEYLFSIIKQVRQAPEYGVRWERRMDYYERRNQLVLRPILIDSSEYPKHLQKLCDWTGKRIRTNLIEDLRKYLRKRYEKKRIWMVELSLPELFSANRRKVGEVLIRADIECGDDRDFKNFLFARIPGYFVTNIHPEPLNPKYRFIPSGALGHVQLYGCEGNS